MLLYITVYSFGMFNALVDSKDWKVGFSGHIYHSLVAEVRLLTNP